MCVRRGNGKWNCFSFCYDFVYVIDRFFVNCFSILNNVYLQSSPPYGTHMIPLKKVGSEFHEKSVFFFPQSCIQKNKAKAATMFRNLHTIFFTLSILSGFPQNVKNPMPTEIFIFVFVNSLGVWKEKKVFCFGENKFI